MDKNPETHLNKITLAKKDVKINNLQTKIVVSLWKNFLKGKKLFYMDAKRHCPVPFPPNQPNYNIKTKL